MSVPSTARSSSADSSSTAWTRRASLRCSSASAARARPARSRPGGARGPRPWRRPCAPPRGCRRRRGRRAPRPRSGRRGRRPAGSPGAAGSALTLNELRPRPAHWRRAGAVELAERAARERRLAAASSSWAASSARSPGVSTSSASAAHLVDAVRARPPPRPRDVAGEAAGAEARLDRVRRREHERVRPGAVPVGDDHHAGRGRAPAGGRGRRAAPAACRPGTSSTRS